jgi:ribulose-bisphosphate carboxylase small chain
MRVTQGTFSFLPDFADQEITNQIRYCIANGWAVSLEHTDDPHPRNSYWDMWGLPMFDVTDPEVAMREVKNCRQAFPGHYIKLNGYDRHKGKQTTMLSFLVNRPEHEPGFLLERTEGQDRQVHYSIRSKRQIAESQEA